MIKVGQIFQSHVGQIFAILILTHREGWVDRCVFFQDPIGA